MTNILFRIFQFLASLELAVFLILFMAVALGVGTVYESKYSAAVASQIVYRSWWMQVFLWLFVINLAAAALSRLPWRKNHIGFLITHLGIIILLLGSWVQQRRGVDGILALGIGENDRFARLDESMLYVFKARAGQSYDLVLDQQLHLDLRKVSDSVVSFPLKGESREVKILRFYPKSTREVTAESVPEGKGVPAIKLKLFGSRASFQDWMFLQMDTGTTREIGPAKLRFQHGKPNFQQAQPQATLVVYLEKNAPHIAVASKGQKFRNLGKLVIGKTYQLGWMDFSLLAEDFRTSAIPNAEYKPMEKKIPGFDGYQALEVQLGNETLWLENGASGQIALDDAVYYIQYTKRQVDLGFDVLLKKFEVGYYEGTQRAKSYSSQVEVEGQTYTISMNEPLHYKGFTLYQSSFDNDMEGKPRASVFSVTYDPGLWVKYAGSLMLVFGIISMFYFKPKYSGNNKWIVSNKGKVS